MVKTSTLKIEVWKKSGNIFMFICYRILGEPPTRTLWRNIQNYLIINFKFLTKLMKLTMERRFQFLQNWTEFVSNSKIAVTAINTLSYQQQS